MIKYYSRFLSFLLLRQDYSPKFQAKLIVILSKLLILIITYDLILSLKCANLFVISGRDKKLQMCLFGFILYVPVNIFFQSCWDVSSWVAPVLIYCLIYFGNSSKYFFRIKHIVKMIRWNSQELFFYFMDNYNTFSKIEKEIWGYHTNYLSEGPI